MERTIPHILLLFFILFAVEPSLVHGVDPLEVAQKHLNVGEYFKAVSLLEKQKLIQPNEAKLHFLLGICYLKAHNDSQAHQAFSVALQIDQAYVQSIGDAYFDAGMTALRDENARKSRIHFQKATTYTPNLQKKIAAYTFEEGNRLFGRGEYELADECFSVTSSFDSKYNEKICNMYFQLGNSLDEHDGLYFYGIASWYSSSHNEEIGLRLLQIAQSHTNEDLREKFKSEAGKYISEKAVLAAFPAPSWNAVHVSSYTGKGYDVSNSPEYHLRTIQYGKEIVEGDRVIVDSEGPIRVWDSGWQERDDHVIILPNIRTPGEYLYLQGPKGQEVTVKVERFK